MPDMATSGTDIFQGVRPTLVTDEGATHGTFSKEAVAESAMSGKTSVLEVSVSNSFENQFIRQYKSRVFPGALNYDCGGPDYLELFGDWEWLEKNFASVGALDAAGALRDRWRRIQGEAPLVPGEYARMLASRRDANRPRLDVRASCAKPTLAVCSAALCFPGVRTGCWPRREFAR